MLAKIIFAISLFFQASLHAQPVADPAYANMQRAMGGIIQSSTQSMGYVSTDPRTYGTLRSVGSYTAAAAAAAGTGLLVAGSAPAWATILAVAAVSGAVSYGVGVTIDSAVKWAFGPGQTPVTVTAPSTGGSDGTWRDSNPGSTDRYFVDSLNFWCTGESGSSTATINMTAAGQRAFIARCRANPGESISESLVAVGFVFVPDSQPVEVKNQTLAEAVAALTESQKNQLLGYDAMALMVNEMWRKSAAEPGYDGVPYSMTNPVTSQQVQSWAEANPGAYPSVGSLSSPVPSGATGFSPSTSTSPSAAVNPAVLNNPPTSTNPSVQPQINIGPDPNILAPNLESTPTAQSILDPLLNLMPDLRQWSAPSHASECPRPTFDFFGETIRMDSMCEMAEQNRELIFNLMLAAFGLAAIMIVLAA